MEEKKLDSLEEAVEAAKEQVDEMEGFTVGLALLDAVPVLFFSFTGIIIGLAASSPIILIGAVLCVLGGLCKVIWKLLLGLGKGNFQALNKAFIPFMGVGFLVYVGGIVYAFVKGALNAKTIAKKMAKFPSNILLAIGAGLMGAMGKVKNAQSRDDFNKDAKKNWLAECVNGSAQLCIFLAVLFAKKAKVEE